MSVSFFSLSTILFMEAARTDDRRGRADLLDLARRIANEDNE